MKLLFVKSNKIGSRLIRWGLGEPVSHVAVLFEEQGVIYHSYLTGILKTDLEHFDKNYTVVTSIEYPMAVDKSAMVFELFEASLKRSMHYDYAALVFFAWRAFLNKFFKVPFPKHNWLQKTGEFLCTEIGILIGPALLKASCANVFPSEYDYSITSPWGLYLLLSERVKGVTCKVYPKGA